jgi:hypothetical protein
MSFAGDLGNFRRQAMREADRKFRGAVLSIYGAVIEATPVDSGRLRSNWFLSVNTPSNETTDDTTGNASQAKAMGVVGQLKIGYSAHLTNNMPYARRIEYEGQPHWQAPAGMLRVTVEKAKPELRKLGFEVQ